MLIVRNKLIFVFLAAVFVFTLSASVFAQDFAPDHHGRISVTLTEPGSDVPVADAELLLYYVATVKLNERGNLAYTYTEDFEKCGISLDDMHLASKLSLIIDENTLPITRIKTDAKGSAEFTDLPLGLYFVKQTVFEDSKFVCTPFIVTVPGKTDNAYVYDINASPKTETAELIVITIKIVWNTGGKTFTDNIPVELLCEDIVANESDHNPQNNWFVAYYDMPPSDAYSVGEIYVPEGYTVTYTQDGYNFIITITSSLIQTGQIIWPIPILAAVGLLLIAVGTAALKKSGAADV